MAHAGDPKELARARHALERGKVRAAIRHGWSAAQAAAEVGDATGLAEVHSLAVALGEQATGRVAGQANMLARYCDELSAEQEAGVKPVGMLGKLFQFTRDRSKTCPDCAEKIKADALVCRYCGYRYPQG